MPTVDDIRQQLTQAVTELTSRGFQTTDPAEQQQIDQQIVSLNLQIGRLNQLKLLEAAAVVSDAAEGLSNVVRSARTGPFDQYVERVNAIIANIKVTQEEAVNSEAGGKRDFPKTEDPKTDKPLPAPKPEPAATPAPAPAVTGLPAVVNSITFADLKAEYEAEWASCKIRNDKLGRVNADYLAKLNEHKGKYEQVVAQFRGMPWFFLGVIHAMESRFNFERHLHNGDPLSARTVRVPKGFPKAGNPPFTWEVSAKDAMEKMGYDRETEWSIPQVLYRLEKYNGFGYRFKKLRTPYLWSFSSLESKGRYVADGVFDPNAVSNQCGAATMLKALIP